MRTCAIIHPLHLEFEIALHIGRVQAPPTTISFEKAILMRL